MADELKLNFSLNFAKDGAEVVRAHSISVDVTGDSFIHQVQDIGTSEEELLQGGDLGTPGYMYIVNIDATATVQIGVTTGVYTVTLGPDEVACFKINGSTIYALALVTSCLVEYIIIEL